MVREKGACTGRVSIKVRGQKPRSRDQNRINGSRLAGQTFVSYAGHEHTLGRNWVEDTIAARVEAWRVWHNLNERRTHLHLSTGEWHGDATRSFWTTASLDDVDRRGFRLRKAVRDPNGQVDAPTRVAISKRLQSRKKESPM